MKKFYLTVDQRKLIVEALLGAASAISTDCNRRGIGGEAMPDTAKANVQANEHLAELFKVEEHET